jgi:hypothetical protein
VTNSNVPVALSANMNRKGLSILITGGDGPPHQAKAIAVTAAASVPASSTMTHTCNKPHKHRTHTTHLIEHKLHHPNKKEAPYLHASPHTDMICSYTARTYCFLVLFAIPIRPDQVAGLQASA